MSDFALDHLGIAVDSIEVAMRFYGEGLGLQTSAIEDVAGERVRVAMLEVNGSRVELLEAMDDASPIHKRGPGLHHAALRVPDLTGTIRRLQEKGFNIIGEPHKGAGGHLCVFVHPRSTGGVLWELIQH